MLDGHGATLDTSNGTKPSGTLRSSPGVTTRFALEVPAVVVGRRIGSRWNGGVWLDLPTREELATAAKEYGAFPESQSGLSAQPASSLGPGRAAVRLCRS